MGLYALTIAGVVVGIAFLGNAESTAAALTGIITVGGVTFVCVKVTGAMKRDLAQIIKYTGYCLMGISGLVILQNCIVGMQPVIEIFKGIGGFLKGILDAFNGTGDKPPWCGGPPLKQ